MDYFKKCNNWTGWAIFAVALVAYILTTEPTASWWDCMEFTATSYKLEVGHPPGAPLFTMIMRLFTLLSFGNTAAVGFAANLMSCTASAFCILFMFWTITHLGRKMYGRRGSGFDGSDRTQVWTVLGAGIIGSLAYAFTDSFWFSAVESEVYALSSMFTALVVWLMLKWEEAAYEPHANRWLILIAYVMGLSLGVHILNLLAIPALVFIYYFRKADKVSWKGVLLALLASGGILLVIYKMIIPWTISIGAWFDRIFVNGMGLPVNSGMVFWVLLLFVLVGAAVWLTHKRGKVVWNTIVLCVGVILIGYSSYASVIIRASVNPPMNSNRPDNPYGLLSLLSRDQYESQPLLFGPSYSSMPTDENKYATTYILNEEGRYEKKSTAVSYKYPSEMESFFPRMWLYRSAASYEAWVDVKGKKVPYTDYHGETKFVTIPTFGEHMKFFFTYQWNFMFWRYFMWNFVGRQNDIQGAGDIVNGNWLSGIRAIDELYLGPQKNLPDEVAGNKGRNKFYFLPFLLGILGIIYQLSRDKRGFAVVLWLFVMLGLALVVYFNITPDPPRERDYIYAGAFYAFAIWIGFGVMWVQELLSKLFRKRECWVSAALATALCAGVPVILCAQGWDDHNRSHRYIGHDLGYNFLISCLPNSIIMNFGDNDTFPLWYNQEVENVRPDVRIMNMSYLAADWYVEQMMHAYNESAPVPFSLPREVYTNDMTYIDERLDRAVPVKWVMDFLRNRDPKTQVTLSDGTRMDYIPTRKLALPVNKEKALASGTVRPEDAHLMVDTIYFEIQGNYLEKPQLMVLDMLANFDWERPIYTTMIRNMRDMGLGDWLQADGWAYRLVPIKTPYENVLNVGRIDTDLSYDLFMNEYKYGNVKDPRVYVDYTSMINLRFVQAHNAPARVARQLVEEEKKEKALALLDRTMEEYPVSQMGYYDFYAFYPVIIGYYEAGAPEKGDMILEDYANTLQEYIEYYLQFDGRKAQMVEDIWYDKYVELRQLARIAYVYDRADQYAAISVYLSQFEEPGSEPAVAEPQLEPLTE